MILRGPAGLLARATVMLVQRCVGTSRFKAYLD